MPDHTTAPHSRPSTKLRDILLSDKPVLSYADFHHQITKDTATELPKSNGSLHTHGAEGKAEKDELVRYMSNLPSYLEKGRNFQEKPLNVGVLDWRRLEKWKNNINQLPHKNSGYTSSTTSTSYFSTEGSSPSSRGRSSSPAQQTLHRTSLQSHLEASPMITDSQDECYRGRGHSCSPARQRTYHLVPHSHDQKVYPLEGTRKFEGISASIPDHKISQKSICGMDQPHRIKESGVSLEVPKEKEYTSITNLKSAKQQSWGDSDVASSHKGKLKIRECELKEATQIGKLKIRESELKEAMQSRKPNYSDCSKARNTVVLLVPRDPSRNKQMADSSDLTTSSIPMPKECRRKSSSEQANLEEVYRADPSRDKQSPHTSALTSSIPMPKECARNSSSSSIPMPKECGSKSSSEQANLKKVHSADISLNVPDTCPLPLQENSKKKVEMSESRSTHTLPVNVPSQHLKLPSGSKNIEQKPSIVVLKSSTATRLSDEVENRNGSQPTAQVRNPSPIRRLSSAMGNIIRSAGSRDNSPLRRPNSKASDSVSLNTEKSQANSRSRSSPLKRLLDPLIKPKAANISELAQPHTTDSVKAKSTVINAAKSTPVQALLKVAVKNGLPLLTFAVDSDSDNILAATVRKCSTTEKNHSSWIYTFLSVHQMKKKNALWPNQGTKGKGQFLPNVVAQMIVSDRQAIARHICTDDDATREFTLFSVDVAQAGNQNGTELQPTNELAAIVVKLLKATQNCTSTTLILPGGVHTVPSKGSISTLTERWRSGGSCDCGGWDLGCQLRIYTSEGESNKLLSSSKVTSVSNEFKLYHQVGQETEPVISLNPFKERIYSVGFNSSISLLQAFATCVAILDCRRPSGLFGPSHEEGRSSSYVSYPPSSPVGRV